MSSLVNLGLLIGSILVVVSLGLYEALQNGYIRETKLQKMWRIIGVIGALMMVTCYVIYFNS